MKRNNGPACTHCADNHQQALHQRLVGARLANLSTRSRRTTAALVAFGVLAGTTAAMAPAHAASFGGFSTTATATPLRIEVHEPSIPIPSDPQIEMNFSYTKVAAASGPASTARASAMWPGAPVGEGLKTFGEQLGLPGQLTDGGYPVQVNAQYPGDVGSASQEPLPGMISRVSTTDKYASSKVSYGTSGDAAAGDNGSPSTAPTNPLDAITKGDLSALGSMLSGNQTAPPGQSVPQNPLGSLGLLIDAGGMTSVSTTNYDGDTVVATATSRLGNLGLAAGLVQLKGVEVSAKTTSNLTDGAKTTYKVTFGGMSIAGKAFNFTSDGFEAAGSKTPIPGLPSDPGQALKALGITFVLPKPDVIKDGAHGGVAVEGLRINIETKPLRSLLPQIPLGDLFSKLPQPPGQAALLTGLLSALANATPELSLVIGSVRTEAATVPAIDFSGGTVTPPTLPSVSSGGGAGATGGGTGPVSSPIPGGSPAVSAGGLGQNTTPINPLASVPGLPPLYSLPSLAVLAALLVASGIGFYLRRASGLLFGGAASCAHGLKAGIPDLRKV